MRRCPARRTCWTSAAGTDTGPGGLEVWRLSTLASDPPFTYSLVGSTPTQTLVANSVNTFTTAITVEAGDLIGLRLDGPAVCETQILNPDLTPNNAVSAGFSFGAAPNPGDKATMFVFQSFQLNVAASVDITIINPPPPPPVPTSADQCKHGGWQGLTDTKGTLFKNQGDCVSFVATGGTNLAGSPASRLCAGGVPPPAPTGSPGRSTTSRPAGTRAPAPSRSRGGSRSRPRTRRPPSASAVCPSPHRPWRLRWRAPGGPSLPRKSRSNRRWRFARERRSPRCPRPSCRPLRRAAGEPAAAGSTPSVSWVPTVRLSRLPTERPGPVRIQAMLRDVPPDSRRKLSGHRPPRRDRAPKRAG